ncbi:BTB/POZ domain-containing protein KCTD21 [Stylophora pistillata]|uniref:BTB/POZ domain-containing protein KCTD21 n=1 Tax=Stylophora pistillata TaxID=50429 RepID=A0A2B4SLH6_STYPI|nr:BTB/POZ domain-containing protein KCTD21 [Stylophora pistillata]
MEDNSTGNQVLEDAGNQIREACEVLQREATRLRQEQKAIDAMSKKIEHVHLSSTVNLNVGGRRFTTSLQTLTKDPDSILAAMFSGKFDVKPSEDGAFFIDRDGKHFRFILNYLRTGKLTLPDGATFRKELAEEAEFYQIQGILDELVPKAPKNFEESVILTNEEHRSVLSGQDDFLLCTQSFVFSMVNPHRVTACKLPLVNDQEDAIYCDSYHGPTFGGGYDLHVSNNTNTSGKSYSNLGYSYQLPTGQQYTFFTGAQKFNVTDYEVFGTYK